MGIVGRVKAVISPPVTAEWADRVITDRAVEADRIEADGNPEKAERYRARTGRMVRGMIGRGII